MPKFKVINPDTPEEIDLVQDIPLVDEETGSDQIDSEGNVLVKRYVTRTVNLNGINAVKNSLPQIKENAKNLKDLYDYSHSVNTDQQNQILENSSKITELLTDTTALEVTVTELENKIKGIQGIDIDDVKADLDALKQSAYLITGGILRGDISVQTPNTATVTLNPSGSETSASFKCTNDMLECTSTWGKLFKQSEEGGFFYGLSSTALADKNGKELTNYISDIMGSNAQLTFIKGDGTSQVISINNVISATKATQDGNGDVIANTYIKSINGVKADANGDIKLVAGGSKEIGEIFYSTTPMDNVNYHLLDGTILDGNAEEYKQFYNYLLSIKPTYASLFITDEEYQTQLNDKGVCGKYVLDEVNKTIRLPKITGFIEGTVDSSALGELVKAGLPNITGSITIDDTSVQRSTASGAFSLRSGFSQGTGWDEDKPAAIFDFNASKSSSIYGNSTTVQPQSIKLFVYVVVNNGSVEDAPLDVTKEYQLNNPFSLFDYRYVSHRLNNASWVLSTNTFLSADLYPTAYEKLLAELNESSIGLSVKRTSDVYTDHDYVVDTENNSFRLPLVIKERVLVESKVATDKDPTWYSLYSDGWCEQGGLASCVYTGTEVTIPIPFKDKNYTVNCTDSKYGEATYNTSAEILSNSTIKMGSGFATAHLTHWYACGYAQDKPTTNLYFYLGDTVSNPSLIELGFVQDRIGRIERKIGNLSKVGGMPDYSAGVSVSLVNSQLNFTASTDGYLVLSGCIITLYINGLKVGFMTIHTGWDGCISTIILNKGDVVTAPVIHNYHGIFFPCKGAN